VFINPYPSSLTNFQPGIVGLIGLAPVARTPTDLAFSLNSATSLVNETAFNTHVK
jgi:hypothetical protein